MGLLGEHFTMQNLVQSDGLPPYMGQRVIFISMMAHNDGRRDGFYHEAVYQYVRCEDCTGLVMVEVHDVETPESVGTFYDPHPRCRICESFRIINAECSEYMEP